MSASPLTPEEYSVLHFTLIPSEEGKPMQKIQACGVYRSLEEAYTTARLLAVREWQRLRAMASTAGDDPTAANWQVLDTEFGYDLKRDNLVVSRFWIHSKNVAPAV